MGLSGEELPSSSYLYRLFGITSSRRYRVNLLQYSVALSIHEASKDHVLAIKVRLLYFYSVASELSNTKRW